MQIRLVIVKSVRLLIKAILSKPLRFSVALLLKAGDEHNDFCDQQQTIIKHRCVTYLYRCRARTIAWYLRVHYG